MRVLVAGATGAMGKELVPRLVDVGHEVFAMVRRESATAKASQLAPCPALPMRSIVPRSPRRCARRHRRWSFTS